MAPATDEEYFPATNAFLRSLTEPEPQRPPSTRSESAAASVNWRVADATERAATDRAERAFRALEEKAPKASKPRKAKKAKAPIPAPPETDETDTYGTNYQPNPTPKHKTFQERQMSTLQLEAPTGVAGCFERAGWMCCVEDNRTSTRPHGKKRFQDALALIPVQSREDAHLFREKVKGRTTDNDGRVADAEDAEGRTLLWHAALHDDVQSAKVLLEQGCAHLILEPDYVHRLSPLQLAQKHSRRELEDMFSSYVTATDRDQHWHHGRIESVSPPSQRGFFS
jgi:hypothetical protein